jgi:hypothetical protein
MRSADAALLIVALVVAWSFYRSHRNPNISFDLFDLIMEGGKLSKVSCLVMGAFTVHTWIMIRLTLDGKMSEGYLTIYGATWVAPMLARMFSSPPPTGTTTTTATQTTEKTVTP